MMYLLCKTNYIYYKELYTKKRQFLLKGGIMTNLNRLSQLNIKGGLNIYILFTSVSFYPVRLLLKV
ncbi:uncharacterized protein BX663DRAFT_492931 [Cokeromyces recurvatus]|uniref:uncharacterized protein n=1 Tax=Cokeromyces recurvatus TaxID=90255 RepID=UPI00221E81EE|nr:uncharacterized protein BX663DRAFT_492931 [Cokeromyces recurvatus]KAI7908086.1 hypothetical protein BX663DRAFT_492931 [Cokeromyces recurvatus]